jgi:lactate racemase
MPGQEVRVPFGKQELSFTLPKNWNIVDTCMPKEIPPCESAHAEACRALAEPIGSPGLKETLEGAEKVAVVVDDISRPTPVSNFFKPVMEAVEAAGVKPENITVITALGVHRDMTDEEIEGKIGAWGFARYRCVNHNFEPGDHLQHLGRTSRGSEVWVNGIVADADVTISFGCVEPHTIAGFGGGYKNLFPGVAGKQTIAANHALNTTPDTFNGVGTRPEDNPMRCDLEECGGMVPTKMFIVNAVLDGYQQVVKIVAGDPIAAHREGIKTAQDIFGAKIEKPADVLITSSHPMNIDLRQGFKAMANLIGAVRPGGIMLNLVLAEQGLGDMNMPSRNLHLGKKSLKILAHLLLPLVGRFTFGMKEEDLFFIYFGLQAMKRNNIYFYSPNIPEEFTRRAPFIDIHNSVDTMLAAAHKAMPGKADVLVFPLGGVSYPVLG